MAFLLDVRFADDILCTNSCRSNSCIGRFGTQIAKHTVAIEDSKDTCFNLRGLNLRGSVAIVLAYTQRKVCYKFCSNRSPSLRFACRKGNPVLGREPTRNVRNFEQSVKNKLGYFLQNFTSSSISIIQWSASVATFFQSSQRFIRENCSNLLVQFIAGRSTGPLPIGCQCSI